MVPASGTYGPWRAVFAPVLPAEHDKRQVLPKVRPAGIEPAACGLQSGRGAGVTRSEAALLRDSRRLAASARGRAIQERYIAAVLWVPRGSRSAAVASSRSVDRVSSRQCSSEASCARAAAVA